MPLRSKPGQGYVSVVVEAGDPLDVAAGRATSQRVSAYYASAYYAAGASKGGGGRWCLAATDPSVGISDSAYASLVERGVSPRQEWSQDRLEAVLRGEGRRLGTHSQVDKLTGETRKVKVAKTDTWVFDVPKSVSLLACYGYDDNGWLTDVIEDAARAGMEYLAQQTAYVRRRGADGLVERQRGSAIHYSLVLERTARAAEGAEGLTGMPAPHYHAHLLIHGAFDRDGRYGAYDAHDALTSGHRQVASAHSDLVMRRRLADRGIGMRRVDPPEDDAGAAAPPRWEVRSIPDEAIAVASERHRAIQAVMAEDPGGRAGRTREAAAEQLTKSRKEGIDDWPALLAFWRRLIEEAGASAPEVGGRGGPGGLGGGGRGAPPALSGDGQTEMPGVDELAEVGARTMARFVATRPTFRFLELRAEVLQQIPGTWQRQLASQLLDTIPARWAASGELVPRVDGRYALVEVLRQEWRVLRMWRELSEDLGDDLSALAGPASAAYEAIAGHPLDEGQDLLVQEALRRRAVVAVGVAGAGKTAAATALRLAGEQLGRRVHSVAMANLRARETRRSTDAHRDESVQAVRHALRREMLEGRYARGDFLLIDEVSQLSDGALEDVLSVAQQRGLHVVMIGDPAQQGAIGRGAMVNEIGRRGGEAVVQLKVAHRFHDRDQAGALKAMHDGDAWPWLQYAHDRGWLRPFPREEAASAEILRLWREDEGRLVVTLGDNVRRDELNALIVAELVARGEVDGARTVAVRADVRTPRRVTLHEGQAVRLNRQLRQRTREGKVERVAANGELARVERIDRPWMEGVPARVTLRFDEGTPETRLVAVDADSLVATGAYAVQCYKAQGSTAERVVVDWEDGRARQQAYPALSRQRDEVIVVGTSRDEDERVRGAAALAERVAEAVERQNLPGAAIARPRAEEWTPEVRVAARRAGIQLPERVGRVEAGSAAVALDAHAGGVAGEAAAPEAPPPGLQDRVSLERVAAAARGEVPLTDLTLGEFNELYQQQSVQGSLDRLGDRELSERLREGVAEIPALAAPALPRGFVREPDMEELGRLTIERGEPQPPRAWDPVASQISSLERAQEAWPAVLEVKAAVLEAALAQLPVELAEAERSAQLAAYRERFEAEMSDAWSGVASQHGVSGAAVPAPDREVLARHGVDDLVLGAMHEPVVELEQSATVVDGNAERQLVEEAARVDEEGRIEDAVRSLVAEEAGPGGHDRDGPGLLGPHSGWVNLSDRSEGADAVIATPTEDRERREEPSLAASDRAVTREAAELEPVPVEAASEPEPEMARDEELAKYEGTTPEEAARSETPRELEQSAELEPEAEPERSVQEELDMHEEAERELRESQERSLREAEELVEAERQAELERDYGMDMEM